MAWRVPTGLRAVAGVSVAAVVGLVLTLAARADATPASVASRASSTSPESPRPAGDPTSGGTAPVATATTPTGGSALVTIPAAGVRALPAVLYPGSPDDARGTTFEERGLAAIPLGAGGGVLPGEVGNLVVTAHRTAAGAPFRHVPSLHVGDHVLVRWAGRTYDYRISGRLWVTFHDPRSYALQVAAVPGRPGVPATRPMITLSTCATPEDNAAGLRTRDQLGNPPHRIDLVGVLVAVR